MQQENQQLRKMLEVKNQQITELQQGTPQHRQTPKSHAQDLQPQLKQLQLSEGQQTEVKEEASFKRINTEMEKWTKSTSCNVKRVFYYHRRDCLCQSLQKSRCLCLPL